MRLIDADALKGEIVEAGQKSKRYKIGEFWELNYDEIRQVIDDAPTMMSDRELLNWVKEVFDYQIIVWQDSLTGLYQPKDTKQNHYRKVYEFREKFLEAMRGRK